MSGSPSAKQVKQMSEPAAILDSVKDYYGKVLSTTADLKTSTCTASARPTKEILALLKKVPEQIKEKFYGCGTPLPSGGIEGLRVLDLGCGSGRDSYLAAALVGENGTVTGIDMTEEQLQVAREYADAYCKEILGYSKCNLRFLLGYIENIQSCGVLPASQDLIISNCVINLSPDKPAVLRGMFDALKFGGEAYFSDVYCDRRLPEAVRSDEILWGECLSGALYTEDFIRICRTIGFADPRVVEKAPIAVVDPELSDILGNARFFSITYRLFKIDGLETTSEDYGQVATYLGSIPGSKHAYLLDKDHVFEANRPLLVSSNTAAMLEETWLEKHFHVQGDKSTHFGLFSLGAGSNTTSSSAQDLEKTVKTVSAAESSSKTCCTDDKEKRKGSCC